MLGITTDTCIFVELCVFGYTALKWNTLGENTDERPLQFHILIIASFVLASYII